MPILFLLWSPEISHRTFPDFQDHSRAGLGPHETPRDSLKFMILRRADAAQGSGDSGPGEVPPVLVHRGSSVRVARAVLEPPAYYYQSLTSCHLDHGNYGKRMEQTPNKSFGGLL